MKKILVIEDTFEVRDNLCEILELSGYEVLAAENGKLGAALALKEQPDLILCDVMMPELDGFGVLKILNKHQKTFDIPFIFLTAKTEKEDFRKGMGLGADDYLTKPFDDVELLEAIEMRLAKNERLQNTFEQTDSSLQQFFSEAKAAEQFEELSQDRELRAYKVKEAIYTEGNQARWLYFVAKGKVKVFRTNEFGKELITQVYGTGAFFGHFPLIQQQHYTDSAETLEATTLRLIPAEDFRTLLFNQRDFAAQFIKMIANQTLETEQQLIELAYSSVRRRVANALLALSKTSKESIHASRNDLAAMAGTAKETLIRTLSDFKTEKLIEIDHQAIRILDADKLAAMPQ